MQDADDGLYPLRVLRLIDSFDTRHGGPPAGVKALDATLRDRGVHVRTLSMRTAKSAIPPLTGYDEVLRGRRLLGRTFSWRLLRRADEVARDSDVVVVHGFYLWVDVVAWLVARRRAKPLVIQPHGVFERYQRRHSRVIKWTFDLVVGSRMRRRTSAVLVASRAEVLGVSDMFASGKAEVVGIGVDLDSEPACVSLTGRPIELLTMSRLSDKKRIDIAIEATGRLARAGKDVHLTVAGTGDPGLLARLKAQVETLNLGKYVTFAGHLEADAKMSALRAATVLLQPSENENFAISVAEALFVGLPCVVTREVATSQFVSLGAGVVIDSPDAAAVADAVLSVVKDEETYACYRRRAAAVAREYLTWRDVAARWEMALRGVVKDFVA